MRKFFLKLIFLAVVMACGKLLIDKTNIGNTWDKPSANKADAWNKDTRKTDAWNLILVNRWNHIPDDYKVDLSELSNGQYVDTRIYPALQAMFDAARNAGIYPVVASGYRTARYQQSLMDEKIKEYEMQGYSPSQARELAEEWVAVSGTSEHQLGIAVDINADTDKSKSYEVYGWLQKNSYKYGFILRYPPDKTDITGTIYEPWHYRYVGVEAATEIYTQGICLEEYLENRK
jgi:D-alanyl-D-alanine carboxypeptidase